MCDVMMTLIASSHQSSLREKYQSVYPLVWSRNSLESFSAGPHSRSHFEDL